MTGAASPLVVERACERGLPLVAKPFGLGELRILVSRLLDGPVTAPPERDGRADP